MSTSFRSKTAAISILAAAMSTGCTLHGVKDELSSINDFSSLPALSWLIPQQDKEQQDNRPENAAQDAKHPNQPHLPNSAPELTLAAPNTHRTALMATPDAADAAAPSAEHEPVHRRDDLWGHIRRNFSLTPKSHPSVQAQLDWLVANPHYLKRISEQAIPYLHYIADNVAQRDMPMELTLLPIVESGYRPLAYSRSGAAGLWQIIAPTGRHLGLKQNWWYDGRRDVVDGTAAALRYLQELHAEFADWPLALAAYNCGRGKVTRARARSAESGNDTDYWSIRPLLPRETQDYVPRLLGLAAAIRDAESLGLILPAIENTPHFSTVALTSQIDLGLAAELANIELNQLQRLNPGFKRWSTDPDGPHRLLIPFASASKFATKLAKIPPAKRVTWRRHIIASGENLGQIARRYGARVTVLKKVNKLRTSFIHAGKTLLVPVGSSAAVALASPPPTRSTPVRGSHKTRTHKVSAGDSLWSIARRYDLRVTTLVQANPPITVKTVLRPGQKLTVPLSKSASTRRPTVKTTAASSSAIGTASHVYTVRVGDSLWSIARRLGYKVSELRQWNNLPTGTTLKPGQRLNLYPPIADRSG